MVPLVAGVPLQAPLAVQLVALVDDQVRVALAPWTMLVGATVIVTAGCAGAVIVSATALEVDALLLASPP